MMRLESLTGLRAIFAMLVVIVHAGLRLGLLKPDNWPSFALSQAGHFGVIGFFILSGFILQSVYEGRSWTIRNFAVNRFARIYPLYLCGLLFALPIDWLSPHFAAGNKPEALGLSLILQQAWFGFANGRFNGPGWTLSVEAFFYLTFPFLFFIIRWRIYVFYTLFLAVLAYTVFSWDPSNHSHSYRFPLLRLWEFMAGIAGAKAMSCCQKIHGNHSWWIAIVILGSAFIGGCRIMFTTDLHFLGWFTMASGSWICIVILALSDLSKDKCRPLSHKFFILGGEISYGLYLFHDAIQRYAKYAFERLIDAQLESTHMGIKATYFIITTCTSLAVAYFAWVIIEKPARTYLRKKLGHEKNNTTP
jgi:peptidoglycan/LPS O-acetylase OafA/YrhL